MKNGGPFPDASVAALCSQNANLFTRDKSSALATTRGNMATLEIAEQLLCLFGPMGGTGKKDDVLADNGRLGSSSSPDLANN